MVFDYGLARQLIYGKKSVAYRIIFDIQ